MEVVKDKFRESGWIAILAFLFIMPTIISVNRFNTLKQVQFNTLLGFVACLAIAWYTKDQMLRMILPGLIEYHTKEGISAIQEALRNSSYAMRMRVDLSGIEPMIAIAFIVVTLIVLRWYFF